jgi:hypothetical protein
MQPAPSEKTTRCDGIVARFTLDLETHLMWTQTAGNPQTEEGLINDWQYRELGFYEASTALSFQEVMANRHRTGNELLVV